MALNLSRMVTMPFGQQGNRGSITMSLGSALFLGFQREDISPGTVEVQLQPRSYSRTAWMGGPKIPVSRGAQTTVRQLGSSKSRAKTNKKLILDAGTTQDTVYYTGTQARAVAFLLAKIKGASIVIRSATGRDLMPVLPANN